MAMFEPGLLSKAEKSLKERRIPSPWINLITGYFLTNTRLGQGFRTPWFPFNSYLHSLFNTRFYLGVNDKRREENLVRAWADLLSQLYLDAYEAAWDATDPLFDEKKVNQKFFPRNFSLEQEIYQSPVEWFKFLVEIPQKSYSVILVEDDQFLSDLQTEMLQKSGIRVRRLPDPREQLEIMRREKDTLTLVISGILQPYTHGLEMLEKARKDSEIKHIPWVISTNLNPDDFAEKAYKLGAARFIHLPAFSHEEWLLEILKFLQERSGEGQSIETSRVELIFDKDENSQYLPTLRNKESINNLMKEYNQDLDKIKAIIGEKTYYQFLDGMIFNPTKSNVVYFTPEQAQKAAKVAEKINELDRKYLEDKEKSRP